MSKRDLLKPITHFGVFFVTLGCAGVILHLFALGDVRYTAGFKAFVVVGSLLHVLIGVGVFLRTSWAFCALKFYLYLLYLVVPIGTYIAIKTLKYIENHDVKSLFK